jgi:hypothetical protein
MGKVFSGTGLPNICIYNPVPSERLPMEVMGKIFFDTGWPNIRILNPVPNERSKIACILKIFPGTGLQMHVFCDPVPGERSKMPAWEMFFPVQDSKCMYFRGPVPGERCTSAGMGAISFGTGIGNTLNHPCVLKKIVPITGRLPFSSGTGFENSLLLSRDPNTIE